MTGLLGTSGDWYLMRGSGMVAFALLTITAVLGIANIARPARRPASRAVAALVHRNVSLLAVVFLGIHVVTAISDKYVSVSPLAILVPGASHWKPFWVGLGALSVDLMIAVLLTSLLRARIGMRAWRAVHWLAYAAWPTALLHALGSGTDTGRSWAALTYVSCVLLFGGAVAVRLSLSGKRPAGRDVRPAYATVAVPVAAVASQRRRNL